MEAITATVPADTGKPIYLVRDEVMRVYPTVKSTFAHTQFFIENELLPDLMKIRNALLLPMGTDAQYAQALADKQGYPAYVSKVDVKDANYGLTGYYVAYYPDGVQAADSISALNQEMYSWISMLAKNERDKISVLPHNLVKRYDFDGAANIQYSETFSTTANGSRYLRYPLLSDFGNVMDMGGAFPNLVKAIEEGMTKGKASTSTDANVYFDDDNQWISSDIKFAGSTNEIAFKPVIMANFNDKFTSSETHSKKTGFTLSASSKSSMTVDVYRTETQFTYDKNQNNFYNLTEEYLDQVRGGKLGTGGLSWVQDTTAVFSNFVLSSNPDGAKIFVDGNPVTSAGTNITLYPCRDNKNEVMIFTKELELYPGKEFDYNDLTLCLYDPEDANRVFSCKFSAHFVPTAGKVSVSTPGNNWVMNTESPYDGKRQAWYMPVRIDGFDTNYRGFDHIELQYKLSTQGDKDWVNVCSFYKDKEPIAGNYLRGINNFEVLGSLVSNDVSTSTSLGFTGTGYAVTQGSRNLSGKSFTVDVMLNPTADEEKMTVFSHGGEEKGLRFGLTADRKLTATINGQTIESDSTVKFNNALHEVAYALDQSGDNMTIHFFDGSKAIGSKTLSGKYEGASPLKISMAMKGDKGIVMKPDKFQRGKNQDYTLAFWFRTTDKDNTLFSNGEAKRGQAGQINIGIKDYNLYVRSAGFEKRNMLSVAGPTDGNWHHFAMTVSRSQNVANVYLDKKLIDSFAADSLSGIEGDHIALGATYMDKNTPTNAMTGNSGAYGHQPEALC